MIESLYEENFAQGRLEKDLDLELTPIMDESNVSSRSIIHSKLLYRELFSMIVATAEEVLFDKLLEVFIGLWQNVYYTELNFL